MQTWSYFEDTGMIRTGARCLDGASMQAGDVVQVQPCDEYAAGQVWDLEPEYGAWNASAIIVLHGTNLCLTPPRYGFIGSDGFLMA